MDILICLDENYLMPTEIMLHSLFVNNKGESITVHAMISGNGDYVWKLKDFVEQYNHKFFSYDMKKVSLPVIPSHSNDKTNYPLEAYYRLFAAEVLPRDIHKLLYMDGDIIINGSLKDLWEVDLTGYALAAAAGFHNNNHEYIRKLGYDPKYGYFNSGVLLINMDYWRDNHVVEAFVDYIKDNMDILKFADQDVLNPVFCDKRLELPLRFNFCTGFLFNDRFRDIEPKYKKEIDNWYYRPSIIHYTTDKPWNSDSINIYKDIWRKYRDQTDWKGYLVIKPKLSLKHTITRFLVCLKYGVTSFTYVQYNKKYKPRNWHIAIL